MEMENKPGNPLRKERNAKWVAFFVAGFFIALVVATILIQLLWRGK